MALARSAISDLEPVNNDDWGGGGGTDYSGYTWGGVLKQAAGSVFQAAPDILHDVFGQGHAGAYTSVDAQGNKVMYRLPASGTSITNMPPFGAAGGISLGIVLLIGGAVLIFASRRG